MSNSEENTRDSILETVLQKYCSRAHTGYGKYRKTLDRKDLSFLEWCSHLQEELMDATLYLEKLQSEVKEENAKNIGQHGGEDHKEGSS
jgi:hypothetical protein